MAPKLVVSVDEALAVALEEEAQQNGRSPAAEHEEILRMALCQPPLRPLKEMLAGMPDVGHDRNFDRHSQVFATGISR